MATTTARGSSIDDALAWETVGNAEFDEVVARIMCVLSYALVLLVMESGCRR